MSVSEFPGPEALGAAGVDEGTDDGGCCCCCAGGFGDAESILTLLAESTMVGLVCSENQSVKQQSKQFNLAPL